MAERSADWLKQARRDLENARWQLEGEYYEWACFVSQQSAEKAVKAVYQKLSGEPWGHSVGSLLDGLREKTEVPEDLERDGRALDRFYVPARYPNGWAEGAPKDYYTRDDAEDAIRRAEGILRFCHGLLAGDG